MSIILVIEDDAVMNDYLVALLEQAGYQVTGAANGKEGIKCLKNGLFDLVITDIVMPEQDGIETIRFVKKLAGKVPIIAVSGGGRIGPENYLMLAQALGADYTFEKPIDKEMLLGAVRECLD